MHLGLEADDGNSVAVVPHAHGVGLEHGLAGVGAFGQYRIGKALACID